MLVQSLHPCAKFDLQKLSNIASVNYNFTNTPKVVPQMQYMILQVNCYCPDGWDQMRQSFDNLHSPKYGTCLMTSTLAASYTGARISCRGHFNNAYLVNEYTQTKHNYVIQLVKNDTHFQQPYTYWIGLSYTNGGWNWEQPSGQPLVPLQNSWIGWLSGYPLASSSKTSVANQQPSSSNLDSTGWVNVEKSQMWNYVCEVNSCDSTNYCDPGDQ